MNQYNGMNYLLACYTVSKIVKHTAIWFLKTLVLNLFVVIPNEKKGLAKEIKTAKA